jgi:uncharacterized SAM-binding protein YcdF (DUF218 family)
MAEAGTTRVRRASRTAAALLRGYLMTAGALATLLAVWLVSPLPLVVEDGLIVNERPVRADAIVCLSGGSVQGLPSSSGWRRIATAARLYKEGFAPLVVFSGGIGSGGRSEAQIYSEAAAALGLPEAAVRLEPLSETTAEHPGRVAELADIRARGGLGASLLIVTSPYHGRRAKGVFRKAGFTNFRVVTTWGVRGGPNPTRQPRTLEIGQKGIDRLYRFITATREWAALAYYRARGWI